MLEINIKEEKGKNAHKEILKNFNMLLAEHELSLRSFCFQNKLDYGFTHGKLNCIGRVKISIDFVQSLVNKIDKSKNVHERNGKWVICKPY